MIINNMENFDKALEDIRIYTEAPIADFDLVGNWNKSAPKRGFDKKSVDLLSNPVTVEKYKKFFKKYPIELDVYFLRNKDAQNYVEYGIVNADFVREKMGWPEFEQNEEHATIIFTNNTAAEKVPLTAWTAAHRLGHALRAAGRKDRGEFYYYWKEIDAAFEQMLNTYLEAYGYRGSVSDRNFFADVPAKVLGRMLGKIGTMRSARMGKIDRPYEFIYEIIAQHINLGEIKFNDPPEPFSFDRMTYRFNPDRFDSYSHSWENTFEHYFNDMLYSTEGKILVM